MNYFCFRKVFCTICIISGCLYYGQANIELTPYVKLPEGTLAGEIGRSKSGREFIKFWCVQYATAERFEAAKPAPKWKGVKDATSCDVRCVNFPMFSGMDSLMGSSHSIEDCLILNVFSPKSNSKPLPVLVFIHGGYFQIGSSLDYSGEAVLDNDVVFVTINYRMGAFGFLSSGDGILESNLGLKDMIMALKWIQKRIHLFGGDPDLVTISGESAGAVATHLLILSPMSKGLFHRAIAQSGSALIPCAYDSRPIQTFRDYVKEINCSAPTTHEAISCLKTKTVEEMVEFTERTKWFMELVYPLFPAIETVPPENRTSNEIFLPDHPRKLLESGNFNHVPLIIGVNENEGALQGGASIGDHELLHDLNTKFVECAPVAMGLDVRNISEGKLNEGSRKLRRFYFGDEDISRKHVWNLSDMFSDSWFVSSFKETIRYHSKHAPVYPYWFTKKGGLQLAKNLGYFEDQVTSHGDDLQYMYMTSMVDEPEDKKFTKNIMKLWTSFVRDGVPTETFGSAKEWPKVEDIENVKYYNLDLDTKIIDEPFKARVDFWDNLNRNEWSEFDPDYKYIPQVTFYNNNDS